MNKAQFTFKLLQAITRTTQGMLQANAVYGYMPAPPRDVAIIEVWKTWNKMNPADELSLAAFKDKVLAEAKAGRIWLKHPGALFKHELHLENRFEIKQGGILWKMPTKYGTDTWHAIDQVKAAEDLAARTPVPAVSDFQPDPNVPAGRSRKYEPTLPPALPANVIRLPLTANEQFLDAMIRQQIYLLRLSKGTQDKVVELLRKVDGDLAAKIRAAGIDGGISPTTLKRLNILKDYLGSARAKTWDDVNELWVKDILALAEKQPEILRGLMKTVSPVELNVVMPAPETLKAIVGTHPFEGRTLKEWGDSLKKTELQKISDQLNIGMVQGESSSALARRIVGSYELGGVDGVTEVTRRNAMAITRTAVNAVMNAVNRDFFNSNAEYFKGERFVATLDSRTTPICRSLDGKVFPVGEGPIPPLHWNCRSIRVVTLDGEALGKRPARNYTIDGLLREFTEAEGIDGVSDRDLLPRGYKGAFDTFMQRRIRELTGQVAADVDYATWLKRQPAAFQDDILGVTKGKLYRTGQLSLDKFVDAQYNEVSLKDLAKIHGDVFRLAGLNPEDFL